MNYLSVCSGVEAATVAWHDLGFNPVAFSEIEKFPSEVLKHHYRRMNDAPCIINPSVMSETLMGYSWKYVVGYYSESLLKAKAHNGATVISLLHLYEWPNKKLKDFWNGTFEKAGILMPKTFEELERMLG